MKKLIIVILFFLPFVGNAQVIDLNDLTPQESSFLAQTKQVNQFFRRFNNEEDLDGRRYDPKDKRYRNKKFRREYLAMLFDESNTSFGSSQKTKFIDDMVDNKNAFLDFHGGEWYAEVSASFTYQNRLENALIYLKLEKSGLGSKWVLTGFHFEPFQKMFYNDTTRRPSTFLHPLSHEVDFMNLRKAFANTEQVEYYSSDKYKIDYLSLLYYEIKRGNLKFDAVSNVKFHILQLPGWYFEISYFNRSGKNSGWLVSNLLPVDDYAKNYLKQKFEH
jgi:hypothetical protein